MYSNVGITHDDIVCDSIARELADKCTDARLALAQAEAAMARVFAKAARVGMQRVAELPSPTSREAELPFRALAAELGAAANMSDRTVQRRMNDAAVLEESFPATFAAWDEGRQWRTCRGDHGTRTPAHRPGRTRPVRT